MKKKFNIFLLTLLVLLLTIGCSKVDENVKESKGALEKYIVAINEKDENTINMLTDENTVSVLESLNAEYIKIKDIKHDPKFNSEDTPKDKFIAFEIKYDIKYSDGNTTSEKKWVALDKVNSKWIIRSVAKA